MATTDDVKGRLPGLQFKVIETGNKSRPTINGTMHGRITLRCEFRDPKLFEAAVAKLNGFKMFSELAEEITDALGAELDSTEQQLKDSRKENERLAEVQHELEEEIARLRGLLGSIDDELDAQGEAFFNDTR